MIAVLQRDDARARFAAIAPEAQRHLDRHFDAGRAAVGIEHIVETRRRQRDEAPRQRFGRLMGEAGEDDLIESLRLIADRLHDRRDGDGRG